MKRVAGASSAQPGTRASAGGRTVETAAVPQAPAPPGGRAAQDAVALAKRAT